MESISMRVGASADDGEEVDMIALDPGWYHTGFAQYQMAVTANRGVDRIRVPFIPADRQSSNRH